MFSSCKTQENELQITLLLEIHINFTVMSLVIMKICFRRRSDHPFFDGSETMVYSYFLPEIPVCRQYVSIYELSNYLIA